MVGFGHISVNSIRHTELANIDIESLPICLSRYMNKYVASNSVANVL